MIRIDPGVHLDTVSSIIQSKYLAVLIFFFALGLSISWMTKIFHFFIGVSVYVFPWYLLFTLIINRKRGWAFGLIIWMGISFLPMFLNVQVELVQYVFSYLPFLFLVLFCMILNFKLKDWGYQPVSGDFPLWY